MIGTAKVTGTSVDITAGGGIGTATIPLTVVTGASGTLTLSFWRRYQRERYEYQGCHTETTPFSTAIFN